MNGWVRLKPYLIQYRFVACFLSFYYDTMAVVHRKINWFEYDYEEKECADVYDRWVIIESVKHIVTIIKAPRGINWYKNNAELLEFIVALERSWELDKVETTTYTNDYWDTPKPWEQKPTVIYKTGTCYDNTILCDNNEHDAKTRTLIWKSSNAGTKLSSKNLSTQTNRYKENRWEEKERA